MVQRLRLHLQWLQQSRRGFSLATTLKQNASYRHGTEEQSPRTSRWGDVERQDRGSIARPAWREGNAPARSIADTEGRGRYSGQSLQPEQLLDQLNKPTPRRNAFPRGREQVASRKPEYLHSGTPLLPPQLKEKVDRFITCGPGGHNDAEAWKILQAIEQEPGEGVLRSLGVHKWFVRAFIGFAMRATQRCVVAEPRQERASIALPRPSELLRLLPVFHIDATDVWARVIWQLASAITERQVSEADAQKDMAFSELMLLWNMAFATRLQRQQPTRNIPATTVDLDWSFLPSLETLAATMGQRDARSGRMSFDDALAMLLPDLRNNRTSRGEYYDFASAALITVDLLRRSGISGGGDTLIGYSSPPQYAPFATLVEGILKTTPTPALPDAFKHRLGDPEVKDSYLGVVERLGLVYAAYRVSTRQLESYSAKTGAAEDVHTAEQPSARQPGDDVAPDVALAEAASRSNPVQDVLLEHQKDNPTTTPASVMQPQADGLPEAVDEAVLLPSSSNTQKPHRSRDEVTDRFVNMRISRLGQAMQKQDASLAEYIKTEILDFASSPEKPPLPDQLYEHLMLALLSLRKAQAAIEVWNHFVQAGRQPTAKTYTVMMRGAQQVRDVNGMEAFWVKMRGAGVQPDIHAWSTRIFGLIRGGKVDFGLRALNDLGQEWIGAARAKQAAAVPKKHGGRRQVGAPPDIAPSEVSKIFEGDIDGVPRPSLVAMNSAVSALASRSDQHIPKVLGWGRTFGLEPDGTTYNVLLNVTMRHGQADEALAILKRMADRGIPADSTTWTVLLSAFFEGRVLDELAPAEQQERIMAFITGLEAATTSAVDQKGYALIIDRLLKAYDNPHAASAVLAHMTSRGLQPTAHIYTILMASYFQRHPPDFAAAEALWRQIQADDSGRGAALDGVFYDRMIEAYATHHWTVGGTAPLLTFLAHATQSAGQRPSWRALHLAARAFAERGEWDRLVQIVDQAREWVRRGDSEMVVGERAYGQRDFWGFVIETGVLRGEGVERPEQVMRAGTGESPVVRRMGGMVGGARGDV
ncbi:hypothetical protein LTR65_000207 [Meristemomyces frigidus]